MTAGTKQKLLAVLLLLALGAFAWWPALRGGFVSLDDAAYVTGQMVAVDGGILAAMRSPVADIFGMDRYPKLD